MLEIYSGASGSLRPIQSSLEPAVLRKADWINVHNPTADEERQIASTFNVELSADEMPRFHPPSDFIARKEGVTATILLLTDIENSRPALIPVHFIHTEGPLISVTRGEGNHIGWLIDRYAKAYTPRLGADDELVELLDMIVDLAGDALEHIGRELERINGAVFAHHATRERRARLASPRLRNHQLERLLEELGLNREILVKLRRSVLSLRRFLAVLKQHGMNENLNVRIATFENDLATIAEAEVDLSSTASFILDGAVGFITIQQSKVVNILTIVGVLLTPPMVIASVYGMNFKEIPELQWAYGYPWALGLMVVSTAAIYWLLRHRGWL